MTEHSLFIYVQLGRLLHRTRWGRSHSARLPIARAHATRMVSVSRRPSASPSLHFLRLSVVTFRGRRLAVSERRTGALPRARTLSCMRNPLRQSQAAGSDDVVGSAPSGLLRSISPRPISRAARADEGCCSQIGWSANVARIDSGSPPLTLRCCSASETWELSSVQQASNGETRDLCLSKVLRLQYRSFRLYGSTGTRQFRKLNAAEQLWTTFVTFVSDPRGPREILQLPLVLLYPSPIFHIPHSFSPNARGKLRFMGLISTIPTLQQETQNTCSSFWDANVGELRRGIIRRSSKNSLQEGEAC